MRKRPFFIFLAIILVCVSVFFSVFVISLTPQHSHNTSLLFEGNMESITGFDISVNDIPVVENSSSGIWAFSDNDNFSNTFCFTFTLSDVKGDYKDPYICFRSYGSSVHVWQDSQLIYELSAKENAHQPVSYYGGRYNLFPVLEGWKESTFRIVYETTFDSGGHRFYDVSIGEPVILVKNVVASNFPSLMIAVVIIIIAMFIALITTGEASRTIRSNILSTAAVFLVTGMWILTQNWSKQLFIRNVTMALDFSYLAMSLLPLVMTTYVRKNHVSNIEVDLRPFEHFSWLYIALYSFFIFLHLTFSINFGSGPLMFLAVLLLAYFICFTVFLIYHTARKRITSGKTLIFSLILYVLAIGLDQYSLALDSPYYETQVLIYLPYLAALLLFLVSGIRESIAVSHSNKEKRKVLRMAYTDPLTGLLNRNALNNRLSHLETTKLTDFYIFMLDINGMKECNDTYGHEAGDELLKAFAESLRQGTSDLNRYIFRYGGDEFLIMVEEKEKLNTDEIIAKIRTVFKSLVKVSRYDFSAGVVRYTPSTRGNIMARIREADSRMYSEKHSREDSKEED